MKSRLTLALVLVLVLLALAGAPLPAEAANSRATLADASAVEPTAALTNVPCTNGFAGPYPCHQVDLVAFLPLSEVECGSAAALWGWTDPLTQKEYALLGCNNGTSFVEISAPVPIFLGRLPAASVNSSWRDVKVIGNHAYVGSEASSHGIQVFDLTRLRSVASPPQIFAADANYPSLGRSHTLATNEANNMLYAAGSQTTCGGDLHQIDVTNPLTPTFAGCLGSNGYVHEAQCTRYIGPDSQHQGKDICITSNGRFDNTDTISIVDVTNPAAPALLSRVSYPDAGYAHQTWLTEDQQYMLLDDEFDEQDFGYPSRTIIWDVRDLDNPVVLNEFIGTTAAVDHNQYIRGNYAFQSNYRAGLRVIDIRDIAAGELSEYAWFDIYPANDDPNYNGAWGNYPYFPSGNVIVSGIEQGLFVLKPILLPQLSVNDVSVVEGNAIKNVTFTITLSAPATGSVLVQYSTEDGTATAGQDYFAQTGSVHIPAGQTTISRQIGIKGDAITESDETFLINLTSSTNADIDDAQGVITIIDDDTPVPTITIADLAVNEGDSGSATATVTLSIAPTSGTPVTVDYETADGTANAGVDYASASGTATFAADASSTTIELTVHGDLDIEGNETFFVGLANPGGGAVIGDSQGVVTIINDDILSVDQITPSSGSPDGGTLVTITGARFEPDASVHFGEAHAENVVVVSEGEITAETPALPPATLVPVHVHNEPEITGPIDPYHRADLLFFSDFWDVPGSYALHDFIETLFRLGITSGCGSGNFCPNATLRRDQMAVLLLRSKYSQTYVPPPATGLFADVPAADPFAPWVEALYNEGITGGCATDPLRFCPASPVSRSQMSVFLLRGKYGSAFTPPPATGTVFDDVPAGGFAAAWIELLASEGITSGCSAEPSLFCPNSPATRGQIAAFLVRAFGLSPD